VLICVIEAGPYEGRHGAVHDHKALGAVCLDAGHRVHQTTSVTHHATPRLDDDGQPKLFHIASDRVNQLPAQRGPYSRIVILTGLRGDIY
jgi:hypothetical protein